MNVKTFKQLIKESVAEAVREELQAILMETQTPAKTIKENKTFNFTSNDITGIQDVRNQLRSKMGDMFGLTQPSRSTDNLPLTVDNTSDNPYLNFIMDAAANMTPQDKAGLSRLD